MLRNNIAPRSHSKQKMIIYCNVSRKHIFSRKHILSPLVGIWKSCANSIKLVRLDLDIQHLDIQSALRQA